jgi:hypothetical protein
LGISGEAFRPTWCCAVGSSLVGKSLSQIG